MCWQLGDLINLRILLARPRPRPNQISENGKQRNMYEALHRQKVTNKRKNLHFIVISVAAVHCAIFLVHRGHYTAVKKGGRKLQALVYDILPSTTAVFSYAIGSRKLSANEQFFSWCSDSSKFVTNNSNKTRRVIYSRQQSLHQHK